MSYTNLTYHLVVRTKSSQPTIPEAYERNLYAYIYAFVKGHKSLLVRVGGMPDHVHLLVGISPTIAVSDFLRELKVSTSKFLKQNKDRFPMFEGWGKEYFACTVSEKNRESVRQYIMNQKSHHAKVSFREELLSLCRDNGIDVDERYI